MSTITAPASSQSVTRYQTDNRLAEFRALSVRFPRHFSATLDKYFLLLHSDFPRQVVTLGSFCRPLGAWRLELNERGRFNGELHEVFGAVIKRFERDFDFSLNAIST